MKISLFFLLKNSTFWKLTLRFPEKVRFGSAQFLGSTAQFRAATFSSLLKNHSRLWIQRWIYYWCSRFYEKLERILIYMTNESRDALSTAPSLHLWAFCVLRRTPSFHTFVFMRKSEWLPIRMREKQGDRPSRHRCVFQCWEEHPHSCTIVFMRTSEY